MITILGDQTLVLFIRHPYVMHITSYAQKPLPFPIFRKYEGPDMGYRVLVSPLNVIIL